MNLSNAKDAQLFINEALLYAQKHDEIANGTHSRALLCNCEKFGYLAKQSGKLAHPYGKLQEIIVTSVRSNLLFKDIVLEI